MTPSCGYVPDEFDESTSDDRALMRFARSTDLGDQSRGPARPQGQIDTHWDIRGGAGFFIDTHAARRFDERNPSGVPLDQSMVETLTDALGVGSHSFGDEPLQHEIVVAASDRPTRLEERFNLRQVIARPASAGKHTIRLDRAHSWEIQDIRFSLIGAQVDEAILELDYDDALQQRQPFEIELNSMEDVCRAVAAASPKCTTVPTNLRFVFPVYPGFDDEPLATLCELVEGSNDGRLADARGESWMEPARIRFIEAVVRWYGVRVESVTLWKPTPCDDSVDTWYEGNWYQDFTGPPLEKWTPDSGETVYEFLGKAWERVENAVHTLARDFPFPAAAVVHPGEECPAARSFLDPPTSSQHATILKCPIWISIDIRDERLLWDFRSYKLMHDFLDEHLLTELGLARLASLGFDDDDELSASQQSEIYDAVFSVQFEAAPFEATMGSLMSIGRGKGYPGHSEDPEAAAPRNELEYESESVWGDELAERLKSCFEDDETFQSVLSTRPHWF